LPNEKKKPHSRLDACKQPPLMSSRSEDLIFSLLPIKENKNQFKLNHCAEKKPSDGSMIN